MPSIRASQHAHRLDHAHAQRPQMREMRAWLRQAHRDEPPAHREVDREAFDPSALWWWGWWSSC